MPVRLQASCCGSFGTCTVLSQGDALLLKRQLLQRTLGYLQFIQWLIQAPLSSEAECRGLIKMWPSIAEAITMQE